MVKPLSRIRLPSVLLFAALVLAGCNGSSSDGNGATPPATTQSSTAPAAEPAETETPEVGTETPAAAPTLAPAASTADAASCESGDVTEADNPCVITTASQLQYIAAASDGHFALGANIDASETATWNDGAGFAPLASFSGSLDGQDYTITGLVIDRPGESNVGLFGMMVDGGHIHGLSLVEVQVTGGMFVGAVVGSMRGGEISQVHSNATVLGDAWVGGLVGSLQADAEVRESSSSGSVTANEERVGGLVGQNNGAVRHSFSLATVQGNSAVGGLVGRTAGTIEYSYTIVDADDEDLWVAGGHSGTDIGGLAGVADTNAVIVDSYTVSFNAPEGAGHPLVGRTWGAGDGITGSYWGGNQSGSAEVRRDIDDMRLTESFDGWDFTDTWSIAEGEDYPDLVSNSRY